MAKIIDHPDCSDLLRVKTFKRPWVMWLYCMLWLPLVAKIKNKKYQVPEKPANNTGHQSGQR